MIERGHRVDLFDATYYQTDHGIDSDGTKAGRLNVVPFSANEKGIKMLSTDWRTDIRKKIDSFEPELIALSTTEDMWLLGVRMLEEIEEHLTHHKIPVIAGGVFPTFAPEIVIRHRLVDMVCVGEGENTMIDLCDRIEKGESWNNVTNIWVKQKNGSITKNPISEPFEINDIPIIDIQKKVFDSHSDPLSLYALKTISHYNVNGYHLVAETIANRLKNDKIFSLNINY